MISAESLGRLPHAYPFLLVDRILMVERGGWAVALKNVERNDVLLGADGVVPPVLLCEIMAQTAGFVVVPPVPHAAAILAAIDRFRCRTVFAGDQLLVIARVLRRFGPNAKVRALVHARGRVRAAGDLVLHLVVPPIHS